MVAKAKKTKETKPEVKPEGVHILKISPVVYNLETGLTTFLWGLGDDDKMYLWVSAEQKWLIG